MMYQDLLVMYRIGSKLDIGLDKYVNIYINCNIREKVE